MSLSKLDLFYRQLILTKFYTRGWGKPEELKSLLEIHKIIGNRKECTSALKAQDYPISLEKPVHTNDCTTVNGFFTSPIYDIIPDLIPNECKVAHFQLVLPPEGKVKKETYFPVRERIKNLGLNPICIHMAGTGDHGYGRRRELLAKPLLKSAGISSLLLENPYYGVRKPKEQSRSGLLHVKDLFIMGGSLILEAQILLNWLSKEGYGPLGLTGISMGGHMASLAATNWPIPIALVPCMSWTSSSVVWTEGVLSKAIPWRVLEAQYAKDPAYETQINEIIKQNTVDSYQLGKDYVKYKGSPSPPSSSSKSSEVAKRKSDDKQRRQKETLMFMKGVMDQMTDLQNFSVPVDPSMVTYVIANADAYYPTHNLRPMNEVWPGCEVRTLNTGHIAGFLMHHADFCAAITDTFIRLIEKYHSSNNICNSSNDMDKDKLDYTGNKSEDGKELSLVEVSEKPKYRKHSSSIALFHSLRAFTIKS